MGVKFISEKEVWLLGSAQSKRQIAGQFYRSTDGGKSFTLAQVRLQISRSTATRI
jgi:hypothetical protein